VISFRYDHRFVGVFDMPVMLSIKNGPRVALKLKAETVPVIRPELALPAYRLAHQFTAVPLGTEPAEVPVQVRSY